jgi:ABC-type lipopolysaccharide export system ATPase subunit
MMFHSQLKVEKLLACWAQMEQVKQHAFYIACGLVRSSRGEVTLDNKSIGPHANA